MERLFVYGTLGPGRPNEHVMQKIGGSWQPASVRGRLVRAGWGFERSGFPALVLDEHGDEIAGHVFVSPNVAAHWPALDAFEGEDYVREPTRAILADGTEVEACVYALAEAKGPRATGHSLGGPSRTTCPPPNAGSRSPAPSASAPRPTEPVAPPLTRTLPASSHPGAPSRSSAATRRGQSHDEPRLQEDWRSRMGEEVYRAGCGHHLPLDIPAEFY